MKQVELISQRRQTREFIDRGGVWITLERHQVVKNDRGGADKITHEPLAAQLMVILHDNPSPRSNQVDSFSAGYVASATDQLMGYWNANVEKGDTFEHDGVKYEVTWVSPLREYETLANLKTSGQ